MPPPTDRQRRWVRGSLLVLASLGVAAGVFVLATIPPAAATFYPKCQLHTLTGLHCPGCGTTRALHALLNGQVRQAFAYNALVVLAIPAVVVWVVRSRKKRPATRWAAVVGWVSLGLFVAFGLLRNLPVYPCTMLAPHELEGLP